MGCPGLAPVDPDIPILHAHIRTAQVLLPQLSQARLHRHLHHRPSLCSCHEQSPHLKPVQEKNAQRDVENLRTTQKQRHIQPAVHKV